MSFKQSVELMRTVGAYLLPSFLRPASSPPEDCHSGSKSATVQTRYKSLDGLRGVSALCVVTYHIMYAFDNAVWFGNGVSHKTASMCEEIAIDEERYNQRSRLLQLPPFRILAMGPAAVAIFFIISGFVLTQRPLRLARGQQWEEVSHTLSSSIIRRPIRLFLPLFIATFISMLLTYMNLMDNGIDDEYCLVTILEPTAPAAVNFPLQIAQWLRVVWQSLNVWDWSVYFPPYDHHLWTISTEFRGSMALFFATLMLCRLKSWARLTLVCLSIIYSVIWLRWDMALFLFGFLFAETSQIKNSKPSELICKFDEEGTSSQQRRYSSALFLSSRLLLSALLLLSLYLLSTPISCTAFTPGYTFLASLAPSSLSPSFYVGNLQLHQCIGAILFVGLLIHWTTLNPLPPIFNTRIAQYLGRISYGLYIIHGPSLHLFGYRLFPVIWELTGKDSTFRYVFGWSVSYVVIMAAIIWLADLFARGIDEPCVRLARKLEGKLVRKDEGLVRLG